MRPNLEHQARCAREARAWHVAQHAMAAIETLRHHPLQVDGYDSLTAELFQHLLEMQAAAYREGVEVGKQQKDGELE